MEIQAELESLLACNAKWFLFCVGYFHCTSLLEFQGHDSTVELRDSIQDKDNSRNVFFAWV